MNLTAFFRSKYDQYKRDTNEVMNWVANAAMQSGLRFENLRKDDIPPFQLQQPEKTTQQKKNAKKAQRKKASKKRAAGKYDEPHQDAPLDVGGGAGRTTCNGQQQAEDSAMKEPNSEQPRLTLLLTISQFLAAVDQLVERKVAVPTELIFLLQRCIDVRKTCFQRFRKNKSPSYIHGHLHFILVLEKVYNRLLTLPSAKTVATERLAALSGQAVEAKLNRFAYLSVEEVEEPEDMPDIALPPQATSAAAASGYENVNFAIEEDEDEELFFLMTFYEDLHSLRDFIKKMWKDYRDGKVRLVTASITTNTAMEVIRNSYEDVSKRYLVPKFGNDKGGYDVAMATGACAQQAGRHMGAYLGLPLPKLEKIEESAKATQSVYDFFFVPVLQYLLEFHELLEGGENMLICKRGHHGIYDARANRASLTFAQRCQQDKILMAESLGDFTLIDRLVLADYTTSPTASPWSDRKARNLAGVTAIDEIATELNSVRLSSRVTLLTLFCTQVFLDINHVMQQDVGKGLKEYEDVERCMLHSLKTRKRVEPSEGPPNWLSYNETGAELLANRLEKGQAHKLFHRAKMNICISAGLPTTAIADRHLFFERHPLFCGLLLFRDLLEYRDFALALCVSWGTLIYCAHLYNEHLHSGILQPVKASEEGGYFGLWKDMDTVMAYYGADSLFAGELPTDLEQSVRSYMLMMGHSQDFVDKWVKRHDSLFGDSDADTLSASEMKPLWVASETGRGLDDPSIITKMFRNRYAGSDIDTGRRVKINIEAVQKLLSAIKERKDTGGSLAAIQKKRKHNAQKFSLIQLLLVLKAGLEEEGESLYFDLVEMHLRCIRVLRRVRDALHYELTEHVGAEYIENEGQLPFLVGYVLMHSFRCQRMARLLGSQLRGRRSNSRLLRGASQALTQEVKKWNTNDRASSGIWF